MIKGLHLFGNVKRPSLVVRASIFSILVAITFLFVITTYDYRDSQYWVFTVVSLTSVVVTWLVLSYFWIGIDINEIKFEDDDT